jgi:Pyridoxamine 5'-phosphate oxidase
MASAGPHLRDIITDERRLSALQLTERLQGMRLVVLATVTADGRPLAGPVDGYFLHGTFWFSTGSGSVRRRHLARRPACSATHLPGEELAITVHGRSEVHALDDPANGDLLQAMLDEYLPKVGPSSSRGLRRWTQSASASSRRGCSPSTWTVRHHSIGRPNALRMRRSTSSRIRTSPGRGDRGLRRRRRGESAATRRQRPRWRPRGAPDATCGWPPCSCE